MDAGRWRQIDGLFRAVSEAEPERRAALLAELAAGDEELRREVGALLEASEAAGGFLEADVFEVAAPLLAGPAHELKPGQLFGRYRILKQIGAGGMGEVYLAEDTSLGRRVALKLLPSNFAADPDLVRRFRHEARAASRLNHPNILVVHEVGQAEGRHFIAAEYVEGETLRAALGAGPLPLDEALDIAAQVAGALARAHRGRIVHRDVKPENVMVGAEGHVKVLDFGLAKRLNLPSALNDSTVGTAIETTPGVLLGTVAYMSPEQARGLEVGGRTDVWSLGVVLYEMLTGRTPFAGETSGDMLADILRTDPPPASAFSPEATADVEEVLTRALAKNRDERYPTASEFLSDLRRLRSRPEAVANPAAPSGGPTALLRPPAPPAEQRKQITVLSASLADLASRLEGCDEEEAADFMCALRVRLGAVVEGAGGHLMRHLGAETLALWGPAVAHEDDPERAVRAALRVQAEVVEFVEANAPHLLAPPAQTDGRRLTRIGVSTGPALLRADNSSGGFDATGAAVNTAGRLQATAPAGAVLISHDTYLHVRGVFDLREFQTAEDDKAQGRAYTVERARPRAFRVRTRGVEGVETRMVGRDAELERLLEALQAVREDRELRVLTVVGDAGLGKSRLLYEFAGALERTHAEVRVFNGRASQSARGLPFALVRDVLSFRFEIQDSDPPPLAREKFERGVLEVLGGGPEAPMRALRRAPRGTGLLLKPAPARHPQRPETDSRPRLPPRHRILRGRRARTHGRALPRRPALGRRRLARPRRPPRARLPERAAAHPLPRAPDAP